MKEISQLIDSIKVAAKKYQPQVVAFLRDLIAIPSPSTREKAAVERIVREMERLGFDDVIIDDFGNVIGRIGTGTRKLLYDSHIDTVDVGEPQRWGFDPFQGKVEKGCIWGRGAADNKAAIATQIYAAHIIKETYPPGLDFSLFILGSVQEEDCDGLAIEYAIKNSIGKIDAVMLGEATNCQIYRGQRGRAELSITTHGIAAHASQPSRGTNAVYKMTDIIKAIKALNRRLPKDDFLGKATIAVSKIDCLTDSLNSIPYECCIYLDRRLIRGEDKHQVIKQLEELPAAKKEQAEVKILKYNAPSWKGKVIEQEKYFPAWALEEYHPLIQSATKSYKALFTREPKIGRWNFSTNGVATMGRLDIPTIGFGPADERFSHSTQDHVPISHLPKATAFYATFPLFWAGIK